MVAENDPQAAPATPQGVHIPATGTKAGSDDLVKEGVEPPQAALVDATEAAETKALHDAADEKPKPAPFGKVLGFSKPERPAMVIGFLFRIVSEVIGLIMPLVTVAAYDAVVENYNTPGTEEMTKTKVAGVMVFVLVLHCVSCVGGSLSGLVMAHAGERVVARLRCTLYSSILSQEIGFFDGCKTGELVSRLGSDTVLVQLATTQGINEVVIGFVKVVTAMTLMFLVSWQMALVVFSAAFLCLLVVGPLLLVIKKLTTKYQDALGLAANTSTEAMGAMRTVRSFVGEALEVDRYCNIVGDATKWCGPRDQSMYHYGVNKGYAMVLVTNAAMFIIFGSIHVSLWYGLTLVVDGAITYGQLTAFQSYQFQVMIGMGQLGASLAKLAEAHGGAQRIFELLERKTKIPNDGGDKPDKVTGEIELRDVSFSYPTRPDAKVLCGFNLTVPTNSTTALVGSSGSGKSTIIGLLLRFYDPASGRVMLDGRDVRTLDPSWLRSKMALVQQEPVLFGMTITENVCYGAEARAGGSQASDEEVQKVCEEANAHDFIRTFPDGYKTLVGERGVKLSGGQKQRIAIARALLAQPRVLLLDEATSALDTESERLVQEAIDRVTSGRTVLVIAHRLSTVRNADQIAVVSEGRVVDAEKHDVLLERCDAYKMLVKRQVN
eukprot:TRINITY_DN17358_c0_g1_i1.p1 TRINITY_DN17358_c0_g1~~TRINITY_DN17358_c0_g1_i1.p1  ORF type:complete len:663 (-),score=138.46 TRINITY_DN17358_c0_g1_i1:364-2352(-)